MSMRGIASRQTQRKECENWSNHCQTHLAAAAAVDLREQRNPSPECLKRLLSPQQFLEYLVSYYPVLQHNQSVCSACELSTNTVYQEQPLWEDSCRMKKAWSALESETNQTFTLFSNLAIVSTIGKLGFPSDRHISGIKITGILISARCLAVFKGGSG